MTILGKHTITETRDLIATVEFRAKATEDLLSKSALANDAKTLDAVTRWTAWRTKWKSVRDKTLADLTALSASAPLVPASSQPSENLYQRVKFAINKSGNDTHSDPDDMFNVIQGIEEATHTRIDETNHPEPSPDDPDLAALQKLDATIKAGEAAARAAKASAGNAFGAIPWYYWAGGAAVAGAVGYVYVSPFLPRRRS